MAEPFTSPVRKPRPRSNSGTASPLEQLQTAYQERQRESQMAAQFGQQLLVQKQEDQEAITQLKQLNEEQNKELESLYRKIHTLETQVNTISSKQNDEEKQSVDEIKNLSAKYNVLRSQLEEAERTNRTLGLTLDQQKLEIEKYKVDTRENESTKEKVKHLSTQLETLQSEILDARTAEQDTKRSHTKILQERDRLISEYSEKLKEAQRKAATLESQKSSGQGGKSGDNSLDQLRSELKEVQNQLREAKEKYSEARVNNEKLEEAVASLVMEHQATQRENEENIRLLDEARSTISTLQESLEERQIESKLPAHVTHGVSNQDSLLGELQGAFPSSSSPFLPASYSTSSHYPGQHPSSASVHNFGSQPAFGSVSSDASSQNAGSLFSELIDITDQPSAAAASSQTAVSSQIADAHNPSASTAVMSSNTPHTPSSAVLHSDSQNPASATLSSSSTPSAAAQSQQSTNPVSAHVDSAILSNAEASKGAQPAGPSSSVGTTVADANAIASQSQTGTFALLNSGANTANLTQNTATSQAGQLGAATKSDEGFALFDAPTPASSSAVPAEGDTVSRGFPIAASSSSSKVGAAGAAASSSSSTAAPLSTSSNADLTASAKSTRPTSPKDKTARASPRPGAKSGAKPSFKETPNTQEYFFLCGSAIKIALACKYPTKSDVIFKINLKEAFELALKQGIPFHEWYPWLYQHLNHIMTPVVNDLKPNTPSSGPLQEMAQLSSEHNLRGRRKKRRRHYGIVSRSSPPRCSMCFHKSILQ